MPINNGQIVKIAYNNILQNEQNMFKVAGVLSYLKNKIRQLFDKDYARKANDLLERTDVLKKILSETNFVIKNIEENISNGDIVEYEANIQILKSKLRALYSYFGDFNEIQAKTINEPAKENAKLKKQERMELSPLAETYKGIKKLSELGVKPSDIRENTTGPKGIFSSWALVSIIQQGEDPVKLEENQKLITDDDIRNIFYAEIPNMIIDKVYPRLLSRHTGKPKGGGDLEIRVKSNGLKLPPPFSNWELKPIFYLIDTRSKESDPLKYVIFRQLIVSVKNIETNDVVYISETPAKEAERKFKELKGFNA